MKRLTLQQYQSLIHNAQTLSSDEHGDKVLVLPDRSVVKLFRRKRLLSSALFSPYAKRFRAASLRLKRRGVKTVEVVDLFRIPAIKRDAVIYRMLDGVGLRETFADPQESDRSIAQFADFLAYLHGKGVYFRAIHCGNVIITPNGDLALIDISEAHCARHPLRIRKRARNFKPLIRYEVDRSAIEHFGAARFVQRYLQSSPMNDANRAIFLHALAQSHPTFAAVE